jgi:UDP-N-acetylglucosamine 2-epimerase (non-hydrolysing)
MKVAPLTRAIDKAETADYTLVYAGREDDPTLEPSLFADLDMPRPHVFLGADAASLNELTGQVMLAFDHYLDEHPTDVVIVVDDLASTMAAAIVTKKRGLRLAHLVAGTRSFDINMPKEVNRLVIDGLSDYLFTAGQGGATIATREGAGNERVFMVGNILIDNLRYLHQRLRRPPLADTLCLEKGKYLVLTVNRKALLNDPERLLPMAEAVASTARKHGVKVVAPLRGLAAQLLERYVEVTPALPYLEFGWLTANALGIVTDSGNVAEEATFNGVPCATLNTYTEHIETVKQGTNLLVGEDPQLLAEAVERMCLHQWKEATLPEQWDGRTAERIVRTIL